MKPLGDQRTKEESGIKIITKETGV